MFLVVMCVLLSTWVEGRPGGEQVRVDFKRAGDVNDAIKYLADLDRVYSEQVRPR